MRERPGKGAIPDLPRSSARQCLALACLRKSQDTSDSPDVLTQAVDGHYPKLPNPPSVEAAVEGMGCILQEQETVPTTAFLQEVHAVWDPV